LLQGRRPKKTIFLTTGAEAIENAVKIARYHTKRAAIITFSGGFHGRTFLGISLTGKVQPYKAGFGPMMPEVYHISVPNGLPRRHRGRLVGSAVWTVQSRRRSGPRCRHHYRAGAGRRWFLPAPVELLLRKLRGLCDQHGILLIVDEIQTGFARTGRMFAVEYSAVERTS